MRGPRETGEWYFRCETYVAAESRDVVVWIGWGTVDTVTQRLAALVASGKVGRLEPVVCGRVSDLLEYFMGAVEDRGDLRPRTVVGYRRSSRHLSRLVGDTVISQVGPATLERVRDVMLREGYATHTVQSTCMVLIYAWRWGREVGLVDAQDIRLPSLIVREKREKNTPTAGDVAAVLEHLSGWPAVALRLLWSTGARIEEITLLKVGDIDFDRAELRVPMEGKTGAREVPLGSEILAVLREFVVGKALDARLWPVGHYAVHSSFARHHLTRACKLAGVRRFTPHGLRRAAVDRMLRAGVDVATAASITGHTPETMLTYYRQVTPEDRKAAQRLAELDKLPKGKVVRFKRKAGDDGGAA